MSELDARFLSQEVPPVMVGGRLYPVRIRMRNDGTRPWTAADAVLLGSQSPQDGQTFGLGRVALPPGVVVPPGASHDFSFDAAAPRRTGFHDFQWRMVREHVAWFGDPTPLLRVRVERVESLEAAFVTQLVPLFLRVGRPAAVRIQMSNPGGIPWTHAGAFRLGLWKPQDGDLWGPHRVELDPGEVVPPGGDRIFAFTITPRLPGRHPFQWRMVQDGVAWFGTPGDLLEIQVDA